MAIDWTRGYTARWRAHEVDVSTWADGPVIGAVEAASVERSSDGDAPLLESGSVTVGGADGTESRERYVRLVMDATQDGATQRVDVATLLCLRTSQEVARGTTTSELVGRSVLYPASVSVLDPGAYAPSGVDGASWAAGLLSERLACPVDVQGSFALDSPVVFDAGTTALEAAWSVLRAGGHAMQVDGRGVVRVVPMPDAPSLVLDRAGARILHPSATRELDWSDVPNRYVAVDGGEVAVAENDWPESPTSTVARGYRHDLMDTSPVRVGGETLAAYAERRLEEESMVAESATYEREWWPDVLLLSLVRGVLPQAGLVGDLRVSRQSLRCGAGIVVTETASREVYAWRRT